MTNISGRRLRAAVALTVLLALLGALRAGDAAAQGTTSDRWSGRWEMTFETEGGGQKRITPTLCCMVVTELTQAQGLAYANGTTGVIGNGVFTDVICAVPVAGRRWYEATSPFEFLSGHTGVVPGPDRETKGATIVFCTEDAPTRIRGHYKNDLGAFDPLMSKPVAEGSILAQAGPASPTLEGSLTHFPGDLPGQAFGTFWAGTCIEGACRQVSRRPALRVTRISAYNALLGFLRGPRGARLELTRPDGTARALRIGERLDLESGDVVTSHGMYAHVQVTRFDGTVVTLSIEPGGSIEGGANPGVIRHRGGTIVAGSAAGFTADSAAFDGGTGQQALSPSAPVRTTVTGGGRVALSLDPARSRLTVRNLAGRVRVESGRSAVTVARGKDVLATPGRVRALPAPPNLAAAVPAPRTIAAGPVQLLMPGSITTRSLARARCLATRLRSTGSATVLVTLLAGTARRGAVVAQRRLSVGAGSDLKVCLPLSVKARGIPAGTPLTMALGVRAGARRLLATGRIRLSIA